MKHSSEGGVDRVDHILQEMRLKVHMRPESHGEPAGGLSVETVFEILQSLNQNYPSESGADRADQILQELRFEVLKGKTGLAAAMIWHSYYKNVIVEYEHTEELARAQVAAWLINRARECIADDPSTDLLSIEVASIDLNWAASNFDCYRVDGKREDLLAATILELQGLNARLPDNHILKPYALANLSVALSERHRSRWMLQGDLDEAITAATRAVNLTDSADSFYASRINHQGGALAARYERDGRIDDLRQAVDNQFKLLDRPLESPSEGAIILHNIGHGLMQLFEVTRDRTFLRQAANLLRPTVMLARQYATTQLGLILSYAGTTILEWRPTRRGIQEAIALQQEGLDLTDPDNPDRPTRLARLAQSWLALAGTERGPAAWSATDQAIRLFTEVLAVTTDTSPSRPTRLLGRAEAYALQWRVLGTPASLANALADYSDSLTCAMISAPVTALASAFYGGCLAEKAGNLDMSMTFFERGLRALDHLVPSQLTRSDQRTWQRHGEVLVAATCVAYVRAGRPDKAVLVLDAYRSRESAMLARTAWTSGGMNEEVAASAREAVAAWLQSDSTANNTSIGISRYLATDAAGHVTFDDLRTLAPPDELTKMAQAAGQGVVYLVAAESGGALLNLRSDGTVSSALLPRLTATAVQRQQHRVRKAYEKRLTAPSRWEEALRRHGRWAGTMVVIALLRLVSHDGPLTLIPCGALAELPLLAAWRPKPGGVRQFLLLGRPVKFATSLRTLRNMPEQPGTASPVAVIGSVPENSAILAVMEAQAMGVCGTVRQIDGASTSAEKIMQSIRHSQLVHFSCHATASRTDAANSLIDLGGSNTMTVAQILRARLSSRPLVILASCETARPDPQLPDQSFGPTTAFLHAGARGVIAPTFAVSWLSTMLISARLYDSLARALSQPKRWPRPNGGLRNQRQKTESPFLVTSSRSCQALAGLQTLFNV